jgi:hypothetical protein
MRDHKRGVGAVLRAAAVAMVLAVLVPGEARSDGDPAEQGLTQKEYNEITEIAPPPPNQEEVARPVEAHKLTDAERAEMARMNAVRVIRGRDWKRLTPEQREARIRTLRDTMPGVSLVLIVPGGDLWAVPPGEENANFKDVIDRKVIRLWTPEEKEAMPVAVGKVPSRNDGANDLGALARAVEPVP